MAKKIGYAIYGLDVYDLDISADSQSILIYLLSYQNATSTFPSINTIAAKTKLSWDTVNRNLKKLEKLNLIAVVKTKGRSNTYKVLWKTACPYLQKEVAESDQYSSKVVAESDPYRSQSATPKPPKVVAESDPIINNNIKNNVCINNARASAPEDTHTQFEEKKREDQRPKPSRIKDCLQPFIRNGDVPHTGFLDWNLFSDLRITNAQLMEVMNLLKPGKDFIPYTTCLDPSALQRKIDSILSKSTNSNVQSIDEGALRAFNKKYPDGKVFEKGSGEAEHWEKFGLKLNYK